MFKFIKSISNALTHFAFASFVLVLPVGYYYESSDSTDLVVGLHGGTGQVATVLRGCDGHVISSEGHKFSDVSGSAYMSFPPGTQSPFIVGIRGGSWETKVQLMDYRSAETYEKKIRMTYYNPNINIETEHFGFGFGKFYGNFKYSLDDYDYEDNNSGNVESSWHFRFGNVERFYFALSCAESTPLISGGGLFNIGFGYKLGKSTRMYSGLGAGFYDASGFVQQVRFYPSKDLALDLAVRLGSSAGVSESAISGGLTYKMDLF
jgi:hypothetical protein